MFFPVLADLKKILVFGAGDVGCRKIELFRDYFGGAGVQIVAVSKGFDRLIDGVECISAEVTSENIPGFLDEDVSLVVSALSLRALNEEIAEECHKRRIPVNVVDSPQLSSVIFPAVLRERDLVVSISTLGKCPFCSRRFKEELDIKERAVVVDLLGEVRRLCIDSGVDVLEVLESVYGDQGFRGSVRRGDLDAARKRALEIFKNIGGGCKI